VRIDPGVKREILAKTDLGSLIGGYVALRKKGNDLVGLCPFHGEKTASFVVHPDRGFFKCFGCDASGDAFSFLQRLENCTFPEALRTLAKRANVQLEDESPTAAHARGEREQIYAANELAAAFFHRMLVLDARGEAARSYAAGRGLSAATIDSFKLGYAPGPPDWELLARELAEAGIPPEIALAAGLTREGKNRPYDFYRGRLMIPMRTTTGEVVSFGGRSLDGSEPKYLNTPTTPVYTKGRGLFALERARRHVPEHGALIVVEGYLDCIALHQAGFPNAVASLGTAFTAEQAAEIRKYAENVFVCFDADRAGQAATAKSIDVLLEAGCSARIVSLAAGDDPDSLVRSGGATAFAAVLDAARPWIEYKVDGRVEAIRSGFVQPAQIAREAELLVKSLPPEEADRWRVYVAGRLGLNANDLRVSRFLADSANFTPRPVYGASHVSAARPFTRHVAPSAQPVAIDRDLLGTLLGEPALFAEYGPLVPPEIFRDEVLRALFERLVAASGVLATTRDVFAALGDDEAAMSVAVALQSSERSSSERFPDTASRRLHLNRILERLSEVEEERRQRELGLRIDALVEAGLPVPDHERAEFHSLVEKNNRAKSRRLGARPAGNTKGGEDHTYGT